MRKKDIRDSNYEREKNTYTHSQLTVQCFTTALSGGIRPSARSWRGREKTALLSYRAGQVQAKGNLKTTISRQDSVDEDDQVMTYRVWLV